ncbi:UDP-N-acetylmuramate dehydrogenase [Opitutaceae bacterium TAV3]|nr:UDP-N-acetylmuramate dehydrogenase [Opitutaceae bacterium TAV3]
MTTTTETALPQHIHAAGIGGMGLGPLAIYLAALGHRVTGSDDHLTDAMRAHLERAGIQITDTSIHPDTQLLVTSSALAPDHPLLQAARTRNIPILRRGELLARLAATRRLVAICGSHGKTTTTALLITALRAAHFPSDYILGGLFGDDSIPPAAANPSAPSPWLVAEIDESDGTIENFSPEITLVTNIDWDHPDHYRTRSDLDSAFARLFARTTGHVLRDTPLAPGPFPAAIQGAFNQQNASAALAAARHMGVPNPTPALLANYPGVRRRQTLLHAGDNLTVIEDYAHHPAEIRALLTSLRERTATANPPPPPPRLIVVFQPHRYSRTRQFLHEFADALSLADELHLLDVYPAGEPAPATPGATTADLAAILPQATHHTGPTFPPLPFSTTPALLAFVGAGNIDTIARRWLADRAHWDAAYETLRAVLPPNSTTDLRREEPLAPKTTMGVGGSARLYSEPSSPDDLATLVRAATAAGIQILMLGRGSNLIVPDEGVDALVLSLRHPAWSTFTLQSDGTLRAGAGLRLKELCGKAMLAGLRGFEFLEGIPGNIGGALRMNAGAMGSWIFDTIKTIDILTLSGDRLTLRRNQLHTGYRHCAELENAIALSATLRPGNAGLQLASPNIARQVDAYRDKRKKSQPREPSAGCIFKNPEGDAAGRLIDAAGLKGLRIGDAEVSPVHANFIVNHGHATAADIITLVREIRARVHAATGIQLEPEAILYGRTWEEKLNAEDLKAPPPPPPPPVPPPLSTSA